MRYTEENVRAGLRVRDGRRKFFLEAGDSLTPAARDWLSREGVEVVEGGQRQPAVYTTPDGAQLTQKPEHMTHLTERILVPKDHPRIRFRGQIDALEADLLLAQQAAQGRSALVEALQEILDCVRRLIRADVLGEPVAPLHLCGLDADEMREHSHYPARYYGQPHFMPACTDAPALLWLNRVRTTLRTAELAAYCAFSDRDGVVTRPDILTALNRLSSLCWILMIRLKAGQFPEH